MANPVHLDILRQGARRWNDWREQDQFKTSPDPRGADLHDWDLHDWDLKNTNLTGADLTQANLRSADARGAVFISAQFKSADLQHIKLTGTNLSSADFTQANLRYADASGAVFIAAQLKSADLSEAQFSWADLTRSTLTQVNLSNTNLTRAFMGEVNLTGADLRGARVAEADLTGAVLVGVRLAGADLTRVTVGRSVFHCLDLSEANGLDTVRHHTPSVISIDTLFYAKGSISEIFLRRAGVMDGAFKAFEYSRSVPSPPNSYPSCFISYSTKDKSFATILHTDLIKNGVPCWFAPQDLRGGAKVYKQIDAALSTQEKLILILSDHSMESDWVKTEIAKAKQNEIKKQRPMLFPIRLVEFEKIKNWECFDADTGADTAKEIREYFIPDFTRWDDADQYQAALQSLLSALSMGHTTAESVQS